MPNIKSDSNINKSLSMDALIAEFNALRQAIRSRVDAQNNRYLLFFAIIAAVLSLAVYNQFYILFIAVPYAIVFLYLKKQEDTRTINIVSDYIQKELGSRIRLITGNDSLMQFEQYIVDRRETSSLNILYLLIDLFGFVVIPFAALIVAAFGIYYDWSKPLIGLCILWVIAFSIITYILIRRLRLFMKDKKTNNKSK